MEIVASQMLSFMIVSAFGFFLGRKSFLDGVTATKLSKVLMTFVIPLTLIKSFIRPFDPDEALLLLLVFIVAAILTFVFIILSSLIFGKDNIIDRYAVIFSNKAFIGIPLITAVIGPEAVIYVTPALIVTNIFVWTFGAKLMKMTSSFSLRNLIVNPSSIGFLIGLVIYVLSIPIPSFLMSSINLMTSLNTPLAMILLGVFLSAGSLAEVFTVPRAWFTSFIKLIVFPVLTVGLLYFMPGNNTFKIVTTIIFACPTAMNMSMQASIAGQDTKYASQITSLTSLLSVVSLPVVYLLSTMVFA